MISLNYRDNHPIYEQLKDSFRSHIIQGVIEPDEKLPSVRDLVSELSINPNTIQRAYRELEAEGYVYTIPGKGSFAAPMERSGNERKKELFLKFDDLTQELLFLGASPGELSERITNLSDKGGTHID